MTTMVKICGLRDPAMVEVAVEAGADAVGFVFAKSVRRVTVAEANHAAAAIPDNVLRIAVMLHPEAAEWDEVARDFRPDVLQTDIGDFDYLDVSDDIQHWPTIREGADVRTWPATFVYEGAKSGAGQTVDWQKAAQVSRHGNMILAGGLSADNVADAIEQVSPWGVDVSSAVESAPGRKDPQKIRTFIEAVRTAGKQN